jgi:very-short-patch-repair endonuclease
MYRWNTADAKYYKELKAEIIRLKNEMTAAETILWTELKSKKLGIKFRRQHMVVKYIADFISLPINLIIEVDGKIHKTQKEYDEGRTFELEELGYKVIRFSNEEVLNNISEVIKKIKEEIIIRNNTDIGT